jgi:hypothetical protein
MRLNQNTYVIPGALLEQVLSMLQARRDDLDDNGTATLNALEDELTLQEAARNLLERLADRRRREVTMGYL